MCGYDLDRLVTPQEDHVLRHWITIIMPLRFIIGGWLSFTSRVVSSLYWTINIFIITISDVKVSAFITLH